MCFRQESNLHRSLRRGTSYPLNDGSFEHAYVYQYTPLIESPRKMCILPKFQFASVVEWSITTDCKSVGFGLRRFESYPTHSKKCSLNESGEQKNTRHSLGVF